MGCRPQTLLLIVYAASLHPEEANRCLPVLHTGVGVSYWLPVSQVIMQ